ncbi:MAG: hypothetical protein DWQ05_01740 [Calditrichaeota bacterium]|nr:MAG: hypothetical protein DWQ05_01740 [Calditrichota bacterium]
MKWISIEKLVLIASGILAITLLNQSAPPLLAKAGLTAFFSVAIFQRIKEKVPQLLAQSILWAGMFVAFIYELF